MESPSTLGELALFRDLPTEHLERLAGLLRRRTFRAGASLITVEQPGEVVYIILTGTVKIHVECLVKPVNRDDLLATLRRLANLCAPSASQ